MDSWKLLLPFGGSTLIGAVVETSFAVCSRVILVTGFRRAELAALFSGRPRIMIVENPHWRLGMFSSIRCGVELVTSERFFVALGDMPLVGPDVFRALLSAPPADAVFPVHAGRRGHPVLFDARLREAVLAADPATGSMREVADRHRAAEIAWGDDSVLRDIDTPEEYARAMEVGSLGAP
jgi:molybdenum cofactor cytidylyltransferase